MPAMNDAHPPELARRVLREQVAAVHANAPAAYLATSSRHHPHGAVAGH
jgi:hypothetical protein